MFKTTYPMSIYPGANKHKSLKSSLDPLVLELCQNYSLEHIYACNSV